MAARLKLLMDSKGLSLEQFGALADVTAQAAQKWMTGGELKEESILKLAEKLKVSPAFIRYGIEAPHPNLQRAMENNAKYSGDLSHTAIEVARLWMSLSEDRQDYIRDLVQITAYTESRFPFLRRGIPSTPSYAKFEVGCEEDMQARVRQLRFSGM